MSGVALVDGVPADTACLDERALQFGDGLFETIAIVDGRPCLWDAHIQRLERGCHRLHLPQPDVALLRREAASICGSLARAVLKLYWTAGRSTRGYRRPDPLRPGRILRVFDWAAAGHDTWRLRLCTHRLGEQPVLAGIKHLNRLDQVIARAEWHDTDIDEGLMLAIDGRVISGTMSNLFLQSGDTLITPALNGSGIAGVVRELICERVEASGDSVRITDLSLDDIRRADAVYMSNSLIGIKRVGCFEDHSYDLSVIEHAAITRARAACHQPDDTSGGES